MVKGVSAAGVGISAGGGEGFGIGRVDEGILCLDPSWQRIMTEVKFRESKEEMEARKCCANFALKRRRAEFLEETV